MCVQDRHTIDDLATELGKKNRVINRSISMLEDALHALRNGSPVVTDEYLERVLADLHTLKGQK